MLGKSFSEGLPGGVTKRGTTCDSDRVPSEGSDAGPAEEERYADPKSDGARCLEGEVKSLCDMPIVGP